jgi:hypothetical protein
MKSNNISQKHEHNNIINLSQIQKWKQNMYKNPITLMNIDTKQISFIHIETEYGILYENAFNLLWNKEKKHFKQIDKVIENIKSKLPNLHCYYINDDIDDDFDFLFYYCLMQKIETKYPNKTDEVKQNIHLYLKYTEIYNIIISKPNKFMRKNCNYSPINNISLLNKYILQIINVFLYEFAEYVMILISNIVISFTHLGQGELQNLEMKLKNMSDLRKISNDLNIEITTNTLTKIFDMISHKIKDISLDKNIFFNENQFGDIIEKIDIGNFIIYTAQDLIQIAKFNQTKQIKEFEQLEYKDIELEEPLKPFLKYNASLPRSPDIEEIRQTFRDKSEELNKSQEEEVQRIYKKQLKRRQDMQSMEKESIDKYNAEMEKYQLSKSLYDQKLASIQEQKISHLENSTKNFNKSRDTLLSEYIGDEKDKCNLDNNEALSSPFSSDFTPLHKYPLYKLQLLVKIHTRDENNNIIRTDCGNPVDLYNYIISYYNVNKHPINPITRQLMTSENIDAIMEMIPFAVNQKVERPYLIEKIKDRSLFIDFSNDNGFYTVFLFRNFGSNDHLNDESSKGIDIPIYQICSFPSDIGDEDSIDRTSNGMAYILETLFSEGKLLHNYMSPFAIFKSDIWSVIKIDAELFQYKTPNHWKNLDNTQTLRLFDELYSNLELFL